MRKGLRKIYQSLPFIIKFWLDKNFRKKIEEVEIVFNFLKDIKEGVMIDVGAHFGTSLKPFAKNGWTIHAFEPDPNNRQNLFKLVENSKNVVVNTHAVSNESGLELSFYSSKISTGISSLSNFHPSHEEVAKVTTITLSDYISSKSITKIDFLKIDTEGHDLFVLQGLNWETNPNPSVIVCEFEDKKSLPLGYSHKTNGDFLINKGYKVLISEWEPIIEYGAGHRWLSISDYPSLLKNSESWGNFIAVKDISTAEKIKNLI